MNDLEFLGKIKGLMTFKEHQQARLLKAMMFPALELPMRKKLRLSEPFKLKNEPTYHRT
jgi:hypothetical protein